MLRERPSRLPVAPSGLLGGLGCAISLHPLDQFLVARVVADVVEVRILPHPLGVREAGSIRLLEGLERRGRRCHGLVGVVEFPSIPRGQDEVPEGLGICRLGTYPMATSSCRSQISLKR